MDISTNFLGLQFPNPVVVAACSLTGSTKAVKRAIDAGAGGIVLRSLFEEEIAQGSESSGNPTAHPEALHYMDTMNMLHRPNDYLTFVEECMQISDVPIIASLNCYSAHWWVDYIERIANMGVDAVELNLSPMLFDIDINAAEVEEKLMEQVNLARQAVKIPICVKLGFYYTSLLNLIAKIESAGINGITIFSRFYKMDIDLDKMEYQSGNSLSSIEEFGKVLRWVGILSEKTNIDVAANTGIYSSEQLIKVILAGGNVGQVCSMLYSYGLDSIQHILDDLQKWMSEKKFESLDDFRGKLSIAGDLNNKHYYRLQYLEALKSVSF